MSQTAQCLLKVRYVFLSKRREAQAMHVCLQGAVDEGYFKQQPWKGAGQARAEVNLHAMTAGVAMLSLYCWLVGLKQQVDQFGSSSLPATLAIVTDKVPAVYLHFA